MQLSPDPEPIISLLKNTLSKSHATGFIIGISGGIDSAVSASLCVRATGSTAVTGIFLPSKVTPDTDYNDVILLTEKLGINIITVPIEDIISKYKNLPDFEETPYLIGNLMARTRMTILYYYANRLNRLVCGTSNYTEFLLGYCTKFGDNAADVQPIIHLSKSEVWDLAGTLGVPDKIIKRTPTAGLWQNQTDEGELGMTYAEIDNSIIHLEKQLWIPETEIERKIMDRILRAGHKQQPAPQIKR